jgi:arylsulfatase A-like enzyme
MPARLFLIIAGVALAANAATSFEGAAAGPFETIETPLGIWTAAARHAAIDTAHANTGKCSLRLLGGQDRQVELALAALANGRLVFEAERWTRRAPFRFRIEARVADEWQEIYNGDKQIKIGDFSTHVAVALPADSANLRFTCTSPPKSGLLIDDVRIVPQRPDHRPNILLIVGEDHGCELSCYGDPVIQTPHIDGLAAGGVLYENGYVTQSVCSPSRSTIFTGLYPHQNGQLGLATHKYRWFRKWPTTYSLLKTSGYRTGLIGKTHVLPEAAVEDYVDFRFQKSSNFAKRKVADYAKQAGGFFRGSDEPFFMTVNYPDAHWPLQGKVDGLPETQVAESALKPLPYVGGDNPRMQAITRNYYDCMLRLDACVGQLLQELEASGKAENTLVIFVGDHGAQMARGKVTVYEGGMRVPFMARWPGQIKAGQRSNSLVSTIDLLPTFLDVAGLAPRAELPGHSLLGDHPREFLVTERNCDAARHTFPQRTIRDSRYKLIHSPVRDREDPAARYYREHGASHWSGCLTDAELKNASAVTQAGYARWLNPPEYQLYDLQTDPQEWAPMDNPAVRDRLKGALKDWQRDTADPIADPAKLQQLMTENDAVFKAGQKSPKGGWQYLNYLAPDSSAVIFQQRPIPEGVPLEGHAAGATKFGYRIPSLLVTKAGSILAFTERRLGLHDHAQNDIVLRRSTDGGFTWSDEIVAYEDGMNSINDPLTVQLENGRILLMFARFPYGRHARDAGWIKVADLGYDDPAANVLTFLCHSDDDGKTWSKPIDISRQVKHPKLLNANTPGAMIQLTKGPHKGRVVTGLWGGLPPKDGKREWRNLVAYSDDNGASWQRTDWLEDASESGFGNECQVAEASNGDLVLVSRNQGGVTFRKKSISQDSGATWSPLNIDRGLPSVACMGSVIKGPVKADGSWDLWASFPSSAGRKDGQIAVSQDHGQTWQIVRVVEGAFAYSALHVAPGQKHLLCLYESNGYRSQTLLTIPFAQLQPKAGLQLIDLDARETHHVIVDREKGQYLGHPTTCLLEDGKTILCVYPKGHGRGGIVYKRSPDGGKTWSDRLPTPDSWATSREVPTLHRVVDAEGNKRLIMWSGLYPARLAVSEDDGASWGELEKAGDWGGIVVMGFVEKLQTGPGHYLAMFHDDGRFFKGSGKRTGVFTLYTTVSHDGGLTWAEPKAIFASSDVHLCEPGSMRSPDGKNLAVLLRENARRKNSHIIFSNDEGKTWSVPREMPLSLTGDRHTGKYAGDGRMFISFRCRSPESKAASRAFEGDWVGWVGTWDDLVHGREGQYQVRCKDNTKGYDTTYPGVEILPDDSFVITTYGHWDEGESPYIRSIRFTLGDLDRYARDY